jgi:hypothetical protein
VETVEKSLVFCGTARGLHPQLVKSRVARHWDL